MSIYPFSHIVNLFQGDSRFQQSQHQGSNLYPLVDICEENISYTNDLPKPIASPQDDESEVVIKKELNNIPVKDLIRILKEANTTGIRHGKLEGGLWMLNLFIIPLIVYPILSIVGHIWIEASNNPNPLIAEVQNELEHHEGQYMSIDEAKRYLNRLRNVGETYDYGFCSGLVHEDMEHSLRRFVKRHNISWVRSAVGVDFLCWFTYNS